MLACGDGVQNLGAPVLVDAAVFESAERSATHAIREPQGDEHCMTRELWRRVPATTWPRFGFDDQRRAHG
jgi:hypothetical protein